MTELAVGCLVAVAAMTSAAMAHPGSDHDHAVSDRAAAQMRQAAIDFVGSLDEKQRAAVAFPFDSSQRTDWQFVPMERAGVNFKQMTPAQRQAAHALLRSALSDKGYLKATAVMTLEDVLRLMEAKRPDVEQVRDQEKYWFAVFGDPAGDKPWGWRVEGHHLSLNFSSADGRVIATTPRFFGANPSEVKVGPRIGVRVLGHEEDSGRALVESLTAEQRAQAIMADKPPEEVSTAPGEPIDLGRPAGIAVAELSGEQSELLWQLIADYAHNLRPELAERDLAAIRKAGFEKVHFAWAGSMKPGEGHYYRIHGPTFIIEYDNPLAEHVHTVWHSTDNDFGLDTLRRHYEAASHDHGDAHEHGHAHEHNGEHEHGN